MFELYMLTIIKNNNTFYVYDRGATKENGRKDSIPCQLQAMKDMIYDLAHSDFKFMVLENGYLIQKKKNYTNDSKKYNFSFIEAYYSELAGPKELLLVKERLENHINTFEGILKDSMFEKQRDIEKIKKFEEYLLTPSVRVDLKTIK